MCSSCPRAWPRLRGSPQQSQKAIHPIKVLLERNQLSSNHRAAPRRYLPGHHKHPTAPPSSPTRQQPSQVSTTLKLRGPKTPGECPQPSLNATRRENPQILEPPWHRARPAPSVPHGARHPLPARSFPKASAREKAFHNPFSGLSQRLSIFAVVCK